LLRIKGFVGQLVFISLQPGLHARVPLDHFVGAKAVRHALALLIRGRGVPLGGLKSGPQSSTGK
jgi:hypothetical protein